MYKTRIYNSIKEIDPKSWDKITNDSIARSHAFLLAVQESHINDCKYFYPVIFNQNDEIVAHTCVYTIITDLTMLVAKYKFLRSCIVAIRKLFPKFLKILMTECGTPVAVGIGHTISIKEEEDKVEICR